jgi:hypothetical protein
VATPANMALNPVRFALWTLRDKAAQRRLALRVCRAWHESSRVKVPVPGLQSRRLAKGQVRRREAGCGRQAQGEIAG